MTRKHPLRAAFFIALTIALTAGWFNAEVAFAGSCCGSSSKAVSRDDHRHDNHRQHQQAHRHTEPEPPFRAPHGGQLARTTWNYFEVVYGPQEARIYVYDMFRFPKSARGIQGQVFMRVRSNGGEYRYPVQYIPVERGHDYLAARVDLTRVHDGDMDVYFDLTGLQNADAPTARFANVFMRPAVAESGHVVGRLPQTNERFTQPARSNVRYQAPQIVVSEATAADDTAIRAQGVCPVMNQPLGSHGRPTKIVINGRSLFVCCAGCIDKVKANPDVYLAQVRG